MKIHFRERNTQKEHRYCVETKGGLHFINELRFEGDFWPAANLIMHRLMICMRETNLYASLVDDHQPFFTRQFYEDL